MRPAKVPGEVVYAKVWASLCERMDPKTHLVYPSWIKMMREIHVCRQRISDAISKLKEQGKIKVFTIPKSEGGKVSDYYYEIVEE